MKTARETHLEEMRELAERILAMRTTLERRETNPATGALEVTACVWDMARELAELVRHYEPEGGAF